MSWRMVGLIAVSILLPCATGRSPVDAQGQLPEVYVQAQAERGGAALAKIRSLHVIVETAVHTNMGPPNRGGGGLPPMDDEPSRMQPSGRLSEPIGMGVPTRMTQLWLALPDRFSQGLIGAGALGVNGPHPIGPVSFSEGREHLIRWAMSLLLVDPTMFDVTLTDKGPIRRGHHVYEEVQAIGPDRFQSVLLFDSHHRLASVEWPVTLTQGHLGFRNGQVVQQSKSTSNSTYREDFSEFKRVHGIELPFTITIYAGEQLSEIDHVAKVELDPKGIDKAFPRR